MPYSTREFTIGPNDSGRRIDRILRVLLAETTLSGVYRLLRDGSVRVSGKRVDGSYRTKAGDVLEIRVDDSSFSGATAVRKSGSAGLFRSIIILETEDIAIVNKPRGMLTHGEGGVDEAARAYYSDRSAAALAFSPAPLHRLDRNTSGALAVSASLAGAVAFSAALRDGLVGKTYLALLSGDMPREEDWIDELGRDTDARISYAGVSGKRAEARAKPLLRSGAYTLASIALGTGRTHQIRAQAAARGYALAGDSKYGGAPFSGGYILHCASIELPPGIAGEGPVRASAPLPSDAIRRLGLVFGAGSVEALLR